MPQVPIVSLGDSAAVVLPTSVLESLGLRIGDSLDITVSDRQLILQSAADAERRRLIEAITQDVFEKRQGAYRRLA
jgi:antitoxin component of MazEF toxin-antitoxin module